MEESLDGVNNSRLSQKIKKGKRRSTAVDLEEISNSDEETIKPNKFKWKNIFHIFTKFGRISSGSSKRSHKESTPRNSETVANKIQQLEELTKSCDQSLIMAINLPDDMEGKDVKVSIELKAVGIASDIENCFSNEKTLKSPNLIVKRSTPKYSVYTGIIKVPSATSIDQVSKMPFYFVNSDPINNGSKIETIIQPMINNLPQNIDKNMLVDKIDLKVNFHNIAFKKLYKSKSLSCTFLYGKPRNESFQNLTKPSQITDKKVDNHDEFSKLLVREILNGVLNKVLTQSSQKATDLKEGLTKEIEVQKSLLMENASPFLVNVVTQVSSQVFLKHPDLSKAETTVSSEFSNDISTNSAKISEESLYTANSNTTTGLSESTSLLYLKAPNNTPNSVVPKYLIKCDGKNNNKAMDKPQTTEVNFLSIPADPCEWDIKRAIREDLKADIDKTLELLETAKNKLMCYLNEPVNSLIKDNNNGIRLSHKDFDGGANKVCELIPIDITLESLQKIDNSEKMTADQNLKKNQFFLGLSQEEPKEIQACKSSTTLIFEAPEESLQDITKTQVFLTDIYETSNSAIFRERYSGKSHSTEPLKKNLPPQVIQNDVNTIIKELIQESELLKDSILKQFYHQEQEDVGVILDQILETFVAKEPSVVQETNNGHSAVKPVYFCLVQDTLHDKKINSINFLEPVKSIIMKIGSNFTKPSWKGFLFKKSKIDFTNLPFKKFEKFELLGNTDRLIEKLEFGAAFLTEIYKEFFHSLQSAINITPIYKHQAIRNWNYYSMMKEGKKILVFEPKKVEKKPSDRESLVEKLEKVINATSEAKPIEKVKNTQDEEKDKQEKNKLENVNKINRFTENRSDLLDEIRKIQINYCTDFQVCNANFADQNSRENLKQCFSGNNDKESQENQQPVNRENEVQPITLAESDMNIQESPNLVLLNSSGLLQHETYPSEQTIVDVMYDFDTNTSTYEPVADVPHAFDSSQEMVQYTNNLNVLQNKLKPQIVSNISVESSSDSDVTLVKKAFSSKLITKQTSKTQTNEVAKLGDSIGGSSISSQILSSDATESAYDADYEEYNIELPKISAQIVRSLQELNGPEEIAKIEKNVNDNYILSIKNTSHTKPKSKNLLPRFVYESSTELLTETSISIESSLPDTPAASNDLEENN